MSEDDQKKGYKKFIFFLIGFFVLILGITLTLAWWEDVVTLFRGGIGIIFSLAGLFTLYAVGKQK